MKICIRSFSALLLLTFLFMISCKQQEQNRYSYDAIRDTIPPVLSVTVPVGSDTYSYGEDIHMVGTVTDLESRTPVSVKAGKLKSLSFTVCTMDIVADTVIKVLFNKNLNVDGKDGYTFNEKTVLNPGSGVTNCRFKGMVTDYADRKDSAVVNFTVN